MTNFVSSGHGSAWCSSSVQCLHWLSPGCLAVTSDAEVSPWSVSTPTTGHQHTCELSVGDIFCLETPSPSPTFLSCVSCWVEWMVWPGVGALHCSTVAPTLIKHISHDQCPAFPVSSGKQSSIRSIIRINPWLIVTILHIFTNLSCSHSHSVRDRTRGTKAEWKTAFIHTESEQWSARAPRPHPASTRTQFCCHCVTPSLTTSEKQFWSFITFQYWLTQSSDTLTTLLIIKDSWERIRQHHWFTVELVWIMPPPLQHPCFLWTVLLGFVWLVQVFRDKRLFLVKGGFTTPTPWTGHVKTLFMLIHRPPTHNYLGELMNSNGNI